MGREKFLTIAIGILAGLFAAGAYFAFVKFSPSVSRREKVALRPAPAQKPETAGTSTAGIILDLPEDYLSTNSATIAVAGRTAPQSLIALFANSEEKTATSDAAGKFAFNLKLEEGANEILAAVISPGSLPISARRRVVLEIGGVPTTNTGAATPVATTASQKAQDVIDRLASRIDEEVKKLRRSYLGSVKAMGQTSLAVATDEGDRSLVVHDATGFYRVRGGSRLEIGLNNLKVGDDVAAVGVIDPETREMTARQIIAKIARRPIIGAIESKEKNVLTVKSSGAPEKKIDLSGAILRALDSSGRFTPAAAADFQPGDYLFALAYASDDPAVLSALKAILLPGANEAE